MLKQTFAILILITAFASCVLLEDQTETYKVEFELEGTTSSASIFTECGHISSQQSNVEVPKRWESCIVELKPGQSTGLYLSAQNDHSAGTITSTIYVDGSVFRTNTSSGSYATATAHGRFATIE